ncbi:hypothetical protein D3C76_1191920 [compost metagenome]
MGAMMADQQPRPGLLGDGQQALAFLQGVGHGFFDQRGDTVFNAGQGAFDMQVIGRGQDHAVRALLGEQLLKARVEGNAVGGSQFGGGRGRVDQGGQIALGAGLDQFDMPAADQPGTGDGNTDLVHGALIIVMRTATAVL